MTQRRAVIVDAVRTPIGKRDGSLSQVHPVDLSAVVLRALVQRNGVPPEAVEDVMWGCVTQLGDQSSNIARFAALAAGWPVSVPGVTFNRACGSSQQAVESAVHAVVAGAYDCVVAGGVESMSRVPLGATRQTGVPYGATVLERFHTDRLEQGPGAEMIAARWNLSRTDLDEYASRSHRLAAEAIDAGWFDDHLVTVDQAPGLRQDEGLRSGTTPQTLARLKPSFREDGVIHAGNASQISDGAAALLITTDEFARHHGLRPLASIRAGAVVGDDPVMMLTAPIPATRKVLGRTGLDIGDIGAFEVNEAFASVPLAWQAELKADPDRVNPLGGAIAVGHPLGASGAVLAARLLHHMRRNGIALGLQTMCEGGGTANATVFELAD
ncbi:thiolase family protein [Streptacidiphilus sp. N1-10]|uniref:Thiolase family protein n=1 Tax=Streptacidiphilus jeojiensis TaxID=3229225 RepID=A0ABV6XGI6_9ACTN